MSGTIDRLPAPENVRTERRFAVRLSDLDINRHVNNVNYIEWAVESVPEALWTTHRMDEFEIEYHAAGVSGDQVRVQCQVDEAEDRIRCLHCLEREAAGTERARARSNWVPRG